MVLANLPVCMLSVKKSCAYIGQCSKSIIVHQFNQTIEMMSNLTILYNGFEYNVAQVRQILSNALLEFFKSLFYMLECLNFEIIFETKNNERHLVAYFVFFRLLK